MAICIVVLPPNPAGTFGATRSRGPDHGRYKSTCGGYQVRLPVDKLDMESVCVIRHGKKFILYSLEYNGFLEEYKPSEHISRIINAWIKQPLV